MHPFQQIYRIFIILLTALIFWNIALVFQATHSPFSHITKEGLILYGSIWAVGLVGKIVLSLGMPSYGRKTLSVAILGFTGVIATLVILLALSNFS